MTNNRAVEVGYLDPKSVFTYGGVNWVVLQRKGAGILCLAEKILFQQAFDENDYNNWEDSTLREHLNNAFLEDLVDAGAEETAFLPMITDLTADDGLKDYGACEDMISLISCQQYRQHRGIIPNADGWWWTCTAYSTKPNGYSHFARGVDSAGSLSHSYACYGSWGVRPLCTLKSSILVSFDPEEATNPCKNERSNTEKRAEALDMMRHIVVAWDFKPEELAGIFPNTANDAEPEGVEPPEAL